jgi:hypothetical protein
VHIPVDKIIGFFFFAMYLSSGKLVISPDATLNVRTPISSNKSTLSLSNGEDKNNMSFS